MTDPGLDRLWQRAWRYVQANQSVPARAALESILVRTPEDVRAHLLLGGVLAAQDHVRAALDQVHAAAGCASAGAETQVELAAMAIRLGDAISARRVLTAVAADEGASAACLLRAAVQLQALGENPVAVAALDRARERGLDGRDWHFYRGMQFGFAGDLGAAEAEFDRCAQFDPPSGHALLQRSRLRRQTAASNHIAAIGTALKRVGANSKDAAALYFAQYAELEDLGRNPEAWMALRSANALVHAHTAYDAVREAEVLDRLLALCTAAFVAEGAAADPAGPQPIFVIGMPRSGTTLVERILGNHSRIASAGELPAFHHALAFALDHVLPLALPDATALARLPSVDWTLVARRYLQQSRWRARGKPLYVDKLPRNWMLAGLIHKALPHAPIIHVVRDPMDVCFSNWRAYFGDGPEYTYAYDLADLAAHHCQYRRVMAHWHRVMPGAILDVDYARLVRQPDAVAREMFAFCSVAAEPGCTDLARNEAPATTLSMAQVREPIHARAIGAWKPYANELAGLAAALAEDAAASA
ncbi:MAG TPA: sulfotransferase [Rhodanobacteraceae bacterium]